MEISNQTPRPTGTSATVSVSSDASLSSLKLEVGQRLQAQVAKILADGQAQLKIAGQVIQARSRLPLQVGQLLELTVSQTGKQVVLTPSQNNTITQLLANALRQSLPQQRPIAQSLQQAVSLLKQVGGQQNGTATNPTQPARLPGTGPLPALPVRVPGNTGSPPLPGSMPAAQQVLKSLQSLIRSLPDLQQLSRPDGLRTAVRDQGGTLESQLRLVLNSPSNTKTTSPRQANADTQPNNTAAQPSTTTPSQTAAPQLLQNNLKLLLTQILRRLDSQEIAPKATRNDDAQSNKADNSRTPSQNSSSSAESSRANTTSSNSSNPTSTATTTTSQTPTQGTQAPTAQQAAKTQAAVPQNNARVLEEVREQIRGALARVEVNQLNSVPREEQSNTLWNLELPLRQGEQLSQLNLRLERRQHGAEEGEAGIWGIQLQLTLPGLGEITANLALQDEQISTQFWTQSRESAEQLQQRLPELEERYRRAGLQPGHIGARQGQAPTPEHPQAIRGPLFSEQA